jgi:hypothetical protein
MVEHHNLPQRSLQRKIKRRTISPPSLPPRWGEGVAPPTTPSYTQYNTPETSPEYRVPPAEVHQQPINNTTPHYPTSGAELLEDLHRRLQAQSIHGTRLPTRPRVYRHKHRVRSRVRSNINHATGNHLISSTTTSTTAHHNRDKYGPMPDLLPTSAWNNPSRHTQYQVIPEVGGTGTSKPGIKTGHQYASSLPTSDYSTSPSTSESPPLLPPPSTHSPPPAISNLPLSVPSPPLQRSRSSASAPLTSTMLGSPVAGSSSSSGTGTSNSAVTGVAHPTSPVSPSELSSIARPPGSLDETTYQNIAQGIVYISSYNSLPCLADRQTTPTPAQPIIPSDTNLSRFNVSPPASVVLPESSRRLTVKPWRSKTLDRYKSGRTKTVTWSADRRSNVKEISNDRKLVKQQVWLFLKYWTIFMEFQILKRYTKLDEHKMKLKNIATNDMAFATNFCVYYICFKDNSIYYIVNFLVQK